MENKSSSLPIILTIALVVALCCLCISLVLLASGAILVAQPSVHQEPASIVIEQPLPNLMIPTPQVSPVPLEVPMPVIPMDRLAENLETLNDTNVPINDPIELAQRLGGKGEIPRTFPDPHSPYQIGDSKAFWVTNVDNRENFRVTATVRYLGQHVYFWIDNKVDFIEEDLVSLGDTFDQQIFPTTRDFFGSEWNPGVDDDPRIHILYASGLGKSLAGYYSSADQLHPDAHEYSNAHEMFLINADNIQLWHNSIYSTLAHELQHMIHWHVDKNEETWLNEGFSMLSEIINGYDPGGFDRFYLQNTDLQLTDWGANIGENAPHYGAAMLFTAYFYDRFGKSATQALVADQRNGMESISSVLADLDIRDSLTDQTITAEDVFADWAVTNYLIDPTVADGRYHYSILPETQTATPSQSINTCPSGSTTSDVAQFGVDYIKISCSGDYTLTFDGGNTTNLLPIAPYSGETYFWSNQGDHSNMYLQRTFDLTSTSGRVEMTYQTWYDLEKDYDYAFVSASTDDVNWKILNTTSCTTENPSGNSYGCGLNGQSGGWQLETVDLTDFTGKLVTVRFDYITDAAVNGDGMVIDNIQVTAINYFTDFESDDGGWQGEGFVRVQNTLPQFFRVSLITFGDQVNVDHLVLDEDNRIEFDINLGEDIESVVLVISGTTPYTRQRAIYQVGIE
jgi:immune inhibitor A